MKQPSAPRSHAARRKAAIPSGMLAPVAAGGVVLLLYLRTAARGYTWAHHGADGGELLAAAMTNGVPHPPGYPLYMLLLQGVLLLAEWISPTAEPARIGNLFSAGLAALAVALTAWTIGRMLDFMPAATPAPATSGSPQSLPQSLSRSLSQWLRTAIATGGAIAFGLTPLVWSQATITEVYALHILWIAVAGLGLVMRFSSLWLAVLLGMGLAHHPTSVLLWPALLWAQWHNDLTDPDARGIANVGRWSGVFLGAGVVGLGLHLRTAWAAGWWRDLPDARLSPVLWGYPDTLDGLFWVWRGTPYHPFVLGVPLLELPGRLQGALALLIDQYTVVGALLILVGVASVQAARLLRVHGTAALWIFPPLIYAVTYNTVDSYIYLLPLVWLMAVGLALGAVKVVQLGDRVTAAGRGGAGHGMASLILIVLFWLGLGVVGWLRLPSQDLRPPASAVHMHARQWQTDAPAYLHAVGSTLEQADDLRPPLLVSSADTHTFTLWYGFWGSGELDRIAPDAVVVNLELYAHGWYQRLLLARHPDLEEMGAPPAQFLAANAQSYTIWLTEPFTEHLPGLAQPPAADGVLWRYQP